MTNPKLITGRFVEGAEVKREVARWKQAGVKVTVSPASDLDPEHAGMTCVSAAFDERPSTETLIAALNNTM